MPNCVDVSNYSSPLTADLLRNWMADGVKLVICQAFPPSYPQYAEQREQMRLCAEVGMPFDCYVYDYLGDPTWLDGALDGLSQADDKPRKVWLDEEDVETERGWTQQQRVDAIAWSVQRAKAAGW
jgi:hypothetical protein